MTKKKIVWQPYGICTLKITPNLKYICPFRIVKEGVAYCQKLYPCPLKKGLQATVTKVKR